jgi:DNA processing protein
MDEREARIGLACLAEPGSGGLAERVAEVGAGEALAELRSRRTRAGQRDLDDSAIAGLVAEQGRRGVRVLVAGDAEFPSQLLDLAEPPWALWVRGPLDLRMATLRSVSVVGARACTAYGERATATIVDGLAGAGWTVVSGGAFGIDAAAHRAALAAGGPTVAVLACGVDVAYPRAHDSLLCRIADTGAIVSELPPGSPALRHRFLARNRLIAAVSRGTAVVEAARRSGAIATANRALEIGRVVMAVPGPITSMASSGANQLLQEQSARAITSSDQVVDLLVGPDQPAHLVGAAGAPGSAGTASASRAAADLPEEARGILDVLPRRGGISVPEVAVGIGSPEATCLARLGLLELSGLATRGRRGWRRCD